MELNDNQLRGIVLNRFYEKRREGRIQWRQEDFPNLDIFDVYRICDQLEEQGLIDWKGVPHRGVTIGGVGKISAFGADVIEGNSASPISITLDQSSHISVAASSNVQIGDSNLQDNHLEIGRIVAAINDSTASDNEKEEAKSLLRAFLTHPLVASIAGGLASTIH